jgi:hypothetical protein
MKRLPVVIFVGVIVSLYYFPIGLSFLPEALNTKMILGMIGAVLFFFDSVKTKRFGATMDMLGATGFALLFSYICYFSTDINYTNDYSYATYFVSFFVWLGGAYSVIYLIRNIHGETNFRLLTTYLAAVCTVQCILALMIDRIKPFKNLVDTYINQGQDFLNETNRLYGIGAALDSAGVRFSIVLILIAAVLSKDNTIRSDRKYMIGLLIAFFMISVVGNMISRTTSVGMAMGFVYLIWSTGILRLVIKVENLKFFTVFIIMLTIIAGVSVYLYNADESFHHNLRFAFEGFFNWMETGEWKTASTDKLNTQMWIWPQDTKSWLIGTGIFGFFVYSTDIGYCRFILYCGLIGFSVFALFFVYNAVVFARKVKRYRWTFLLLMALSFIVWLKVATDIFLIYALFYCLKEREWRDEVNALITRR